MRIHGEFRLAVLYGFVVVAVLLAAQAFAFAQGPAQQAQSAQQAMAGGNYGRAIEIYSRLSVGFPENLDVKRNLALALHSAARYREALHCFDFILQRAPRDKAALLFSGIELTSMHEPAKAILNLTKFLQEDAGSTGFLARGRAYLSIDQYSSAIEDFAKAVELDPGNTKAWEGLGKAYLLAAQRAFEFVEERGIFSAEWYALLARSYSSGEDYKTAFRFFHEAESRGPDLPGVHAGLAEVYRQTKHADWAAIESTKEEKANTDPHTELRRKYLDALSFQQRGAEALAHLARNPETAEYHGLLGLAYRIQRRDADSAGEFRRALALSPNSPNIKLELATSLAMAKDCNGAMPLLQEVLKADPNSAEADHVLGECLLDQHRTQEAISALQTALKLDSHLLPAESALGRAYLHSGDYRQAVDHLGKVSDSGDPSILYQLAQAYKKLGDNRASGECLAKYAVRVRQVQQANQAPVGEITPP